MLRTVIFSIGLFILFSTNLYADLPEKFKSLSQKYRFNEANYGFAIQNLSNKTKKPIIHNAEKSFNTASLVKIFTTYIALKDLGPSYKWRSEFLYTGKVDKDILKGDLIFRGTGDASFSIADLEKMIREVQRLGIKKITGNLVLDYSFFGVMPKDINFDDNPYRAYNVLPSPISVQSNTINFKFNIDKNIIEIISEPNLSQLTIINNLKKTNRSCANWKSSLGVDKINSETVEFKGSFSDRCVGKEIDLALLDNSVYFHENFKDIWQRNGGLYSGIMKKNFEEPTNAIVISTHHSKPVSELIRDINKFSLNLMARNLMLTIIKEVTGERPTEDMVNGYVNSWLSQKEMTFENFYVDNGAGLSRDIKISPNQLLQILQKIYNDPLMPEIIASFPIASIDGTLRDRMQSKKFKQKGHFKTGSLKDVVGIAGFFLNNDGDMHSFVFIMNGKNAKKAQPFIDDLIGLNY